MILGRYGTGVRYPVQGFEEPGVDAAKEAIKSAETVSAFVTRRTCNRELLKALHDLDTFPIVRRRDIAAFGHDRAKAITLAYDDDLVAGHTDVEVAVRAAQQKDPTWPQG